MYKQFLEYQQSNANTAVLFDKMVENMALTVEYLKQSFTMRGIPSENIAVTVFGGDDTLPRDDEAAALWEKAGIKKENIYFMPRENNWWGPAGLTGPCGTDTEMFVIRKAKCSPTCNPDCNCGAFLEIWNDVFMRFNKQADGSFTELSQKNVDTGMGLERALCVLNGKSSVYVTTKKMNIVY